MSVWKFALAGALTGAVNGFFGGGGGCVLVPLLTGVCGLEPKKAFATSVAVVLPLSNKLLTHLFIPKSDDEDAPVWSSMSKIGKGKY